MRDAIKKLNYVFTRTQKVKLLTLFFAISVGAFLELLGVSIILPFVNAILNPTKLLDNKWMKLVYEILHLQSVNQLIIVLSFAIVVVYIAKNAYLAVMYNSQYRFSYDNQRELSVRMMECYIRQPYFFHLSHSSSEMIQKILNDASMLFAAVLGSVQLFTEILVCMVLILYLLFMDVAITLGVSCVMVFFLAFYFLVLRRRIQEMGVEIRKDNVAISKRIIEGFGGIKEVKVLDREDYFVNAFDGSYRKYAECFRKYQVYSILPRPLMEAVCISGLMLVVAFKIYRGVDMEYFVPVLSVFAIAAFRMLPSFSRITSHLSVVIFNKSAVDSVYMDLKEMEQLSNREKNDMYSGKQIGFEDKISVCNLSFTYPNSTNEVLHNISLEVKKNSTIALIGPSGQGKTTLADIILGVLHPSKGHILVDGADIQDYMYSWHQKLGYIPQTIFLVDDTIRSNIAFGIEREKIDEAAIWNALEEAQLKEFVETLEDGLDTRVGERGVRLSGGQRQRIGIARALYNNPDVLILDEATSALDNDTETAVMEAIDNLQGNKTLIIIAHRLTTIRNCEYIFEVNQGCVQSVDKNQLFDEIGMPKEDKKITAGRK